MAAIDIERLLFSLRDSIHLQHLNSTTHNEHLILGDLYNSLSENLDRALEIYISYGNSVALDAVDIVQIDKEQLNVSRKMLNDYIKTVEQEDYKTVLIDILANISKAIYLLK